MRAAAQNEPQNDLPNYLLSASLRSPIMLKLLIAHIGNILDFRSRGRKPMKFRAAVRPRSHPWPQNLRRPFHVGGRHPRHERDVTRSLLFPDPPHPLTHHNQELPKKMEGNR